jgi:hypothetical protein
MQSVHFLLGGLRLTIFSIPQTFKTQVAIGSWARTPLYPGLSETIKLVEKQMRGENKTRAGEKETELDDAEDSDEEARFLFCDIEFLTVAMVYLFIFYFAFLMTSSHALCMQYSFVFYIFKIFGNFCAYYTSKGV